MKSTNKQTKEFTCTLTWIRDTANAEIHSSQHFVTSESLLLAAQRLAATPSVRRITWTPFVKP